MNSNISQLISILNQFAKIIGFNNSLGKYQKVLLEMILEDLNQQ